MLINKSQIATILGDSKTKTLTSLLDRKGCYIKRKQEYVNHVVNGKHSLRLQFINYYDLPNGITRLQKLIDEPPIDKDTVGAMEIYNMKAKRDLEKAIKEIQLCINNLTTKQLTN